MKCFVNIAQGGGGGGQNAYEMKFPNLVTKVVARGNRYFHGNDITKN